MAKTKKPAVKKERLIGRGTKKGYPTKHKKGPGRNKRGRSTDRFD